MIDPSLVRMIAATHGCRTPKDLLEPSARAIIARVCRPFLLEARITPTELLHDPAHQAAFNDARGAYMDAVQKVARVRVRQYPSHKGPSVHEICRELYDVCDAQSRRVVERHQKGLPKPADPDTFQTFAAGADLETINLALTRALAARDLWAQKADFLISLLAPDLPAPGKDAVDAVLAEIMELGFNDVFGPFETGETAVHTLLDLLTDTDTTEDPSGRKTSIGFALQTYGLGVTRISLRRQLERFLDARKTYVSGTRPDVEIFAHIRICERISKLAAAPAYAELLDLAERKLERWLSLDLLQQILGVFADPVERFKRALILHRRVTGGARAQLRRYIDRIFEESKIVSTLQKRKLPPMQVLRAIAEVHSAVQQAQLADSQRQRFTDHLAQAQANILRERRIFDQLERAAPDLPDRVNRLVRLCCAGIFVPGAALDMVRRRIAQYVHHADFRTAYLEGCEGDAGVQRMTELGTQLRQAGVNIPLW